jgi:TonB family protein
LKTFISIFFLICGSLGAFGQIHKHYLDRNLKSVKDSTKAAAYELYQRTPDSSEWSVVLLSKKDNVPILKGYYLDEDLTVPHGKFVYYQPVVQQQSAGEHKSTVDTMLKVARTGYYENGHKEGIWMRYYPNGKRSFLDTFEDDTLSGPTEAYNDNGGIMLRGNMDHGLRVGDWYSYRADSSISGHSLFVRGTLRKEEHFGDNTPFYGAYSKFDFYGYLGDCLKKDGITPIHGEVMISVTVNTDGQLTKPKLILGINKNFDEALMHAIENSPKWMPARQNDVPITQELTFILRYTSTGVK